MKIILCLFWLLAASNIGFSQHIKTEITGGQTLTNTGSTVIKQAAPAGEINPMNIKSNWRASLINKTIVHETMPGVDEIRESYPPKPRDISAKTNENMNKPLSGVDYNVTASFEGNPPDGSAPSDNSIAVSRSGYIVSATNSSICGYLPDGRNLFNTTIEDFVSNPVLTSYCYDPHVIYDTQDDRFIMVYVHGYTSKTSKVIVLFSGSENPADPWYYYILDGDVNGDNAMADYPNIAISNDELFISINLFSNTGYYKSPVIYQISKAEGFTGGKVNYRSWSYLKEADNQYAFSILPVSYGGDGNYGPGIYMVATKFNQGNTITLYDITGSLGDDNTEIKMQTFSTSYYKAGSDALMKGAPQGLDIGDCRALSGFYLDGRIQFTFNSAYNSGGYTGINYNRMDLKTGTNRSTLFGIDNEDNAYSSVAWLGASDQDNTAAFCYLSVSAAKYPEVRAITCDNNYIWSTPTLIRQGYNPFKINQQKPSDAIRWGDYSGIARQPGQALPTMWLSGEWGRADMQRGTFIASLKRGPAGVAESNSMLFNGSVYPIPVTDKINVTFNIDRNMPVIIAIYDVNGRLIKKLFEDTAKEGENMLAFNAGVLTAGVYFLRITSPGKLLLNKEIVVTGF